MSENIKLKLGEILIREKIVTREQLDRALDKQRTKKKKLGKVLTDMGVASEEEIAGAISRQLDIPYMDLEGIDPAPEATSLLDQTFLSNNLIIPINVEGGELTVAVSDPHNIKALDKAAKMTGLAVLPVISTETGVVRCIDKAFHINDLINKMMKAFKVKEDLCFMALPQDRDVDVHKQFFINSSSPPVRMLAFIITDAFNKKAGEILLEPLSGKLRLRYRIMGDLTDIISIPGELRDSLISHLKMISNLDLANRETPQAGKSELTLSGRPVRLEVSTLPASSGESVCIRLFDRERRSPSLKELQVPAETVSALVELTMDGQGLILFTGTKGSGKTTAMYSLLESLVADTRNLITIQEHTSYKVGTTTQLELGGLKMADALRHAMNNRPDVVLLEALRDRETATIAMEASDGCIVLAGVNAAGPAEAVTRLLALGADPHQLAASITGAVNSRLIRTICPGCRQQYSPDLERIEGLGLPMPESFLRGTGCQACHNTGYKGHSTVIEVSGMDAGARSLIGTSSDTPILRNAYSRLSSRPLIASAWEMVVAGASTVEELRSKIPPIYWPVPPADLAAAQRGAVGTAAVPGPTPPADTARNADAGPAHSHQPVAGGNAQAIPPPPDEDFRDTMRQHKVLLAVSSRYDQENISKLLDEGDLQTIAARDGKHALDLLYSEDPDLLICDMRLPELQNLTTYKKLYDAQRKHVPVIMIVRGSANGMSEIDKDLGVDFKMVRPINIPKLGENITTLLSERTGRGWA